MTTSRLIACRYTTVEAAKRSWDLLATHFADERAAGIATMRCIGTGDEGGETHIARNAAMLAREGRSGTFTTRRPTGSGLVFDSAGGYGPERRLYG